jgi:hypothetical protein
MRSGSTVLFRLFRTLMKRYDKKDGLEGLCLEGSSMLPPANPETGSEGRNEVIR